MSAPGNRTPRLRRFSAAAGPLAGDDDAGQAQTGPDRCELCAEPLPGEHRHLADLAARELLCACRACSILFDHNAAGGSHYRLVPEERRRVPDFDLDESVWAALGIPVGLAFFFQDSAAGRMVGFYPSPAGPVEADLDLRAWSQIETLNPVLRDLRPDVQALLVRRSSADRQYWLAPIDQCYALVALVRANWEGFSGGDRVWSEIDAFFTRLARGSDTVRRDGTGPARPWGPGAATAHDRQGGLRR